MHRGDAGRQRGGGRARAQRAAEQLDRTRVGAQPAAEDIHQRGLAGAVLAEQRHDLARASVEIDVVEGKQRPKRRVIWRAASIGERRRRRAQADGGGP